MSALPQRLSRRLARFGGSVCGATDLNFRWPHAPVLPCPPTPPHDENRPHGGQTEQVEGAAIGQAYGFLHAGGHRVLKKPGDWPQKRSQVVDLLRKTPPRLGFESTPFRCFGTRNRGFATRAPFLIFGTFYLSLSLVFIGERDRKRRKTEGKRHPRIFEVWRKNNPEISPEKIKFGGRLKIKTSYKSTAYINKSDFPRSPARNAYTPLEKVRNER